MSSGLREQAAAVHDIPSPRSIVQTSGWSASLAESAKLDPETVLSRLDTIESLLGITRPSRPVLDDDVTLHPLDADSPFNGVWAAAIHLKTTTRPDQNSRIWTRAVIQQLWLS